MDFPRLADVIFKHNSFIVTSHIAPDGDAVGSVLALTTALEKLGKNVSPIINDVVPAKYNFLPHSEKLRPYIPEKDRAEVMICLDSGDVERLDFKKDLKSICELIVNLDHHKSNSLYGDINIIDDKSSAVGEMVYYLVKSLNVPIDIDIATCIYTAIITDTGSIKYSNTTPSCLKILSEMVEIGVRPDFISREVFEKKSYASILLLKEVLGTLKLSEGGKIAYMELTKDMLKKVGAKEEDADGFINFAREIESVEVAVLFREQDNLKVKVGLRSNVWVDVSKIAEEFGGGGHARAAGCTLEGPLEKAKNVFLSALKEYMQTSKRDRDERSN